MRYEQTQILPPHTQHCNNGTRHSGLNILLSTPLYPIQAVCECDGWSRVRATRVPIGDKITYETTCQLPTSDAGSYGGWEIREPVRDEATYKGLEHTCIRDESTQVHDMSVYKG